jgi:hypothetical protein
MQGLPTILVVEDDHLIQSQSTVHDKIRWYGDGSRDLPFDH